VGRLDGQYAGVVRIRNQAVSPILDDQRVLGNNWGLASDPYRGVLSDLEESGTLATGVVRPDMYSRIDSYFRYSRLDNGSLPTSASEQHWT
jgi:hypothetical protein